MTVVYRGDRTIDGIVVLRDDVALDDASAHASYSAVGMDWGFFGPAAQQLAFALIHDRLGDVDRARRINDRFARLVVSELDNEWELDADYIDAAIVKLEHA